MTREREALKALVEAIGVLLCDSDGRASFHGSKEDLRLFTIPLESARAVLAEPESGWQPMETAPKDKTILLWGHY